MYFGAPPFGVLFFSIRCLQKEKIDPNLLPRTPFRPRKKKKRKEANRSTSTCEAEDEVLTALSTDNDLGKKVDMILNKLQKIDNIEARLDNVHKSIASLKESFAFLGKIMVFLRTCRRTL